MGYTVRPRTREELLVRAELQADALLFQADEAFARSVGINLTPLEVACGINGSPSPPATREVSRRGRPPKPPPPEAPPWYAAPVRPPLEGPSR